MSGITVAAFLLASPAANVTDTVTAEEAMAHYREAFRLVPAANCPVSRDPEDIVVCGRRDARSERLPLPVEPEPGERVRLLPGEMPSAVAAMNAGAPAQGGGINIIGTAITIVNGIDRLIHGD